MNYDAIRALNWSSLKFMHVSPLEFRCRVDHPEERRLFVRGAVGMCLVIIALIVGAKLIGW